MEQAVCPRSGMDSILFLPIQSPGGQHVSTKVFSPASLQLALLVGWVAVVYGLDMSHLQCRSVGSKSLLMPKFRCRTFKILRCRSMPGAGCIALH